MFDDVSIGRYDDVVEAREKKKAKNEMGIIRPEFGPSSYSWSAVDGNRNVLKGY